MTTTLIGQSPFKPVTSFTAIACGMERVTMKEPAMKKFDLVAAIRKSQLVNEQLVGARAAILLDSDPAPFIAEANAQLVHLANAMDHFADPITDDAHDDAAMAAVENRQAAE